MTEVKDFLLKAIKDIEGGVEIGKRSLEGPIEFEISATVTSQNGGEIKAYIVETGGKVQAEQVQKMKFKVNPHYPELNDDFRITPRIENYH